VGFEIRQGDVLERLREIPDDSIHCCVTSPPYWGLRDYGTARWEGGLPGCDHVYNHGVQGAGGQRADRTFTAQAVYRDTCRKCGAQRIDAQLGLERTPEEYVSRMVEVFREVRRVIRGTLWLNIGDSYCSQGGPEPAQTKWQVHGASDGQNGGKSRASVGGLKPKDLVGIPWRVAFALQADGWYLRSDIIWSKPNPMPESVTDRPTKAHEYLFLLAKSERYFYDAEAIKEPSITSNPRKPYAPGQVDARGNGHDRNGGSIRMQKVPSGWDTGAGSHGTVHRDGRSQEAEYRPVDATTRNRRTVWEIATQPFPEAHFATFPEALVEPCILAGCHEGGTVLDPFCGSGTVGVVALRHRRNFIGIELNPEYVAMAERRIGKPDQVMLDLSRCAAEQTAIGDLIREGHPEQEGLNLAAEDSLHEEAIIRGEMEGK
jgi:DNA modification methylase